MTESGRGLSDDGDPFGLPQPCCQGTNSCQHTSGRVSSLQEQQRKRLLTASASPENDQAQDAHDQTWAGRVLTPPLLLDGALDAEGRHVLRGTAANGEPLAIRIPCADACRVCTALQEAGRG